MTQQLTADLGLARKVAQLVLVQAMHGEACML